MGQTGQACGDCGSDAGTVWAPWVVKDDRVRKGRQGVGFEFHDLCLGAPYVAVHCRCECVT